MDGTELKQRLSAILAADVAGYARLMALNERATVAALDAAREVFRNHVESDHGRIMDMAGDSVMAVFETAKGAVSAALAAQRDLATMAGNEPQDRRMRFRIGITLGDVIEKADGTVYGDGVNIAARLQQLAEPGGIAVTDSIEHAVKGKVPADFEDHGEHVVKNIADPVRVFHVVPQGKPSAHTDGEHRLALPDKPSLAVLPFANLSGDSEQEYFVDGVVDDIITALSRIREIFVIARNSSFTFKGKAVDIKRVGRELGVRYVLEGSFRKAGSRMRIAAQLIDADTGRHVWVDQFEGSLDDVFDLQDRLADRVAAAMEPKLRLAEIERARSKPSENLQPYDLCLRALPDLNAVTSKAANDVSIGLFRRAIEMDPGYAYAKALCAIAYALRSLQGWITDAEVAQGILLAEQALADHHDDPTILGYAGFSLSTLGHRHEEALHAIDRALALNPNSTRVLACAGWVRDYVGDARTAMEHFERAMRLSPLDPEMGYMLSGLGFAHLVAGDLENALGAGRKALQESPHLMSSHYLVTICLASLGRMNEAAAAAARLLQLDPGFSLARTTAGLFRDPDGSFEKRNRNALRAALALQPKPMSPDARAG